MATWNRDDSDLVIGTGIGSTTIGSNLTISNNEIDCASGDLLLDAGSDLILDADSSNILLKDNGVLFGGLHNNSGQLTIKSAGSSAINLSGANTTLLGSLSIQPVSGDGSSESFLVVDTGDNIVKKRTGAQVRSDLGISDSEIIDWTTDQGSTNIHVNNVLWESGNTFDNDNQGLVPNPGSTGTTTKYLREDGTFQIPPDTNTQLSTEQVQDIIGDMFSGNTETRINVTYDDTGGKIDLAVDNLADNAVNSEHYTDGSIDTDHIADDQVTYAKIQNVSATDRILGRDSSGAGIIEEITPANLKTMLSLNNVENTALSTFAGTSNITTLASNLSLGGSPTTTTQTASDNSTKVATTAYVDNQVSTIVDSAPGTLNTLNELAAALGDDASFSTTVTNSIATKAPLASPTFTGTIAIPNIANLETAVSNNTSKVTNVSTALSVGTNNTTELSITSDGGTDDVTLPVATTSLTGVMNSAMFDKLDGIATNATANTGDIDRVRFAGDTGTHTVGSGNADWTVSGGTGITTSISTSTITIAGTDATSISKGVAAFSTDNFAVSSGNVTIKDEGVATAELDNRAVTYAKMQNVTDARMLGNNSGSASSPTEMTKANVLSFLDVADGAQVNVATNLTKTASGTGYSINSSTGDNIALTLADTDNWGLMSDEMFDTLAAATSNTGTVTSVAGAGTINGLTLTGTVTSSGNLTLGGTLAINNGDWSGTALADGNIASASTWNSLVTNATHTGDVTGSTSLTIAADSVSYAKMQNMTNARMLGNNAGSDGIITEMTQANVLSFLGIEASSTADQTQADINSLAITEVGTITSGVWSGTAIADAKIASASTWNGKQDSLTFGISNTNAVKIDDANVADNEYARFTASGLESRTLGEIKTDIGTGNSALVPAAGSAGEFLKHDGTFGTPSYIANTDVDVSVANLDARLEQLTATMVTVGDATDVTIDFEGGIQIGQGAVFMTEPSVTVGGGISAWSWSQGNKLDLTLASGATAITFDTPHPQGGCSLTLKLTQPASGSAGTAGSWNASGAGNNVKWSSGTAPTLSTANGAVDILSFYWDGTNYYGVASLNFS